MTRAFGDIPSNETGWPAAPPTLTPAGAVVMWTTSVPPSGWLLCDGSAVSRSTYADLWAVLGTTFGPGDGSSTFNLPDMQGRVPVGVDGGDSDFDTIGETGGAKTEASAGSNAAPTFTGSALAGHAHGAGTYNVDPHAGAAVADHASHTHEFVQGSNNATPDLLAEDTSAAGVAAKGTTAGPDAALSHNVTQPNNHTFGGTSASVSGGTPAGTVSAPAYTGSQTSVVQPYLALNFIIKT